MKSNIAYRFREIEYNKVNTCSIAEKVLQNLMIKISEVKKDNTNKLSPDKKQLKAIHYFAIGHTF